MIAPFRIGLKKRKLNISDIRLDQKRWIAHEINEGKLTPQEVENRTGLMRRTVAKWAKKALLPGGLKGECGRPALITAPTVKRSILENLESRTDDIRSRDFDILVNRVVSDDFKN